MRRAAAIVIGASFVLAAVSASANSRHANATHVQAAETCIRAALRKEGLANKYYDEWAHKEQVPGGTITPAKIAATVLDPALTEIRCARDEISKAQSSGEISQNESTDARDFLAYAIGEDDNARAGLTQTYGHVATELGLANKHKNEALAVLEKATSGTTHTYHYKVTVEVSATGDNFVTNYGVPGTNPSYSGTMSASFTLVFPAVFTVDDKAHTVSVESAASTSGHGIDSFTLTATDPAQPTDTCTVPAHTPFKAAGALAPTWGGGADTKSYAAGVMHFSLSANADKTKLFPCSASTPGTIINVTPTAGITIPGMNLGYVNTPPSSNPSYPNPGCVSGTLTDIYLPIPVSDLGKHVVTTTFHPGPIKCQGTVLGALYTAHVIDQITLERTG